MRQASLTLYIEDNYLQGVVVNTDTQAPGIGRTVTPAEALATELLNICKRKADQVNYQVQGVNGTAQRNFLCRLLDFEDLAHAVSAEVRDGARIALGIAPAEQARYTCSIGVDINAVHERFAEKAGA